MAYRHYIYTYLSNRISNRIANYHQNAHEPNKICTYSKSISGAYCLGNNLKQKGNLMLNFLRSPCGFKQKDPKSFNAIQYTSPKARTKVTESTIATY